MDFPGGLVRFLTVYVAQGFVGVFFLYLAYRILKRDTKRLNLIFSGFYICGAVATFINFIYAPLTIQFAVLVLNSMTNYFMIITPVFLLIFDLILLKSEKVIDTKKQFAILIGYGVILLIPFLIPGTVTINASTNWRPVWSIFFSLYVGTVITVLGILPNLFYSYRIYQKFEDEILRKKWKFFIGGLILIYCFFYALLISNTFGEYIEGLRTVFLLISFVLLVLSPILIFYGVGKTIRKN